mmetsp:Transcript_5268/g.17397  ORF Transcript_5268/g.17397 Transcript_5268/m.17397 type:complete len:226 (-) Transcript_5268:98-775(-)
MSICLPRFRRLSLIRHLTAPPPLACSSARKTSALSLSSTRRRMNCSCRVPPLASPGGPAASKLACESAASMQSDTATEMTHSRVHSRLSTSMSPAMSRPRLSNHSPRGLEAGAARRSAARPFGRRRASSSSVCPSQSYGRASSSSSRPLASRGSCGRSYRELACSPGITKRSQLASDTASDSTSQLGKGPEAGSRSLPSMTLQSRLRPLVAGTDSGDGAVARRPK